MLACGSSQKQESNTKQEHPAWFCQPNEVGLQNRDTDDCDEQRYEEIGQHMNEPT